ncbi:V-type ATP synthase subunit I [Angelakisella massiliensis]|uniref:V-type ATP synthase subunit I n=1 Tax=Angelakisella massiliensis TaxID=1871018 RepID=UPI0008F8D1D2|nr:V-type ATP synthase subunit I [Angelakisella massiliensis]
MIERMEKLFLYGLSGDAQQVLGELMRCGCLQITDPETMDGYEQLQEMMERPVVDLYGLEQTQARLASAINVLSPYFEKQKLLQQKPKVAFDRLEDQKVLEEAEALCQQVETLQREMGEKKSQVGKIQFRQSSLEPWKKLDLPLDQLSTRSTQVQLMTVPVQVPQQTLEQAVEEAGLPAYLSVISEDGEQRYLAVLCHKTAAAETDDLLRQNGAIRVSLEDWKGTAGEASRRCRTQIDELQREIALQEKSLKELAKQGEKLKLAYDSVQVRIQRTQVRQDTLETGKTYLLAAWVPVRRKEEVDRVLSSYPCYYEYHQPAETDDVPILLKNNKLVEPFEAATEMYSLPIYGSVDPDPFMAPFFFLFFGMMLSDAGYGIILTVAGLLGAKWTGSKLMKMLGYCGISTIFWGAVYGSWFGDSIPAFAQTFLGLEISVPTLIDPLKDPITILALSFIFGALHLFVGMGLKAYLMVKRGHPWQAFFDVGLWYFVLIGLPLLLLGEPFATVGKWMAIGGAAGLVLTQGREKKNPIMKLISGVMSLYDITGYFSDVLSYSRIMALGLATGVIATVINTMGTIAGGGIVGFILFLAVFVLGHVVNLGINALGSYVHTSRLQYVEFFGKFFEGGGHPFRPLRTDTKYYVVNKQEAD